MTLDELTRDELIEIMKAQAIFTSCLRRAANIALSHASHLLQNYAPDVPDEKLSEWHEAQINATALLIHPGPVSEPRHN